MTTASALHAYLARLYRTFATDKSGATAIEYAMIAAGIGTAIAATVWTLGSNLNLLYTNVSNAF
jgi:pilus assembly protein Flp/PilA